MKEYSGIIDSILFNQILCSHSKQFQKNKPIEKLRKLIHTFREPISTCLAILGMGTIILATTYLFFTQLAKYGW
jgi:hypothetical protein